MPRKKRADLERVALLIGQLELGGAERQLSLLALELHERGIEVHVLVLSRSGPHEAALRAAGIEVHHLGFARWCHPLAPVRNLFAFARMVRLLVRIRPDVLHAYLLEDYLLGTPAARLARVPVVVSGRRGLSYFRRVHRFAFPLGTLVTRLADHVVANAAAVAEDVRTAEHIPAHKISVIYNGLSRSAFDRADPELIDTRLPVVLCVARLAPEKGLPFLIDAAAVLSQRNRPCTVVLVGDGPERRTLEARAHALGADVRFLGARTNVWPLLAGADVVVLPSLTEGMSNAVMEAMAAGRPIVATAVGGTPELLEDRGVLVPPADAVALSDGISRLLDDRELAAELGTAARTWARKNLDLDVMADEHVALYRRLLGRKNAG